MGELTADRNTVLVLGAYGLAGREVVRGLIERTKLAVIASGRNERKLATVAAPLDAARLQARVFDATEPAALTRACEEAALVINCVGPYTEHGAEIAGRVIRAGRGYVDFANEQSHYKRLQGLDAEARTQHVPLVTAAGAIPGVSTVLAGLAAKRLPGLHSVELLYAQGRMPDNDAGLASLLSAILESGLGSVTLRDGRHVPLRLGEARRTEDLPAPFGATSMIGFPTADELIVPQKVALRCVTTYWAMGDVPPGFFSLIRLLKPHARPWAYKLVRRLMEWSMQHDYARAVKKGIGPEAVLKVVGHGPDKRWEALAFFRDGGVATAFLPVLVARRFGAGAEIGAGLLSPLDVFDPDDVVREMVDGNWASSFREGTT